MRIQGVGFEHLVIQFDGTKNIISIEIISIGKWMMHAEQNQREYNVSNGIKLFKSKIMNVIVVF